MIRTINPDIIQQINILLEPKPIIEDKQEKVEDKNEERTEEMSDETSDGESDDEYNKEQVEKFIPNKISFLSIDDEFNTKIVKRDNPVIYGMGVCPCGGRITPSNKARHLKNYRHQRYITQIANE